MIHPVVWPSIAYAEPRMLGALHLACCVVLCARLRAFADRVREEQPC